MADPPSVLGGCRDSQTAVSAGGLAEAEDQPSVLGCTNSRKATTAWG